MLFRKMNRKFLFDEAEKNLKTKEDLDSVELKFKEEEKKQSDIQANVTDFDAGMKAKIEQLYIDMAYTNARAEILEKAQTIMTDLDGVNFKVIDYFMQEMAFDKEYAALDAKEKKQIMKKIQRYLYIDTVQYIFPVFYKTYKDAVVGLKQLIESDPETETDLYAFANDGTPPFIKFIEDEERAD